MFSSSRYVQQTGRYTYEVRFEGCVSGRELGEKWDVIGRGRVGGSECSRRPIFFVKEKKMDLCKKSSFWLWRPTVNPSFNDNEVYW